MRFSRWSAIHIYYLYLYLSNSRRIAVVSQMCINIGVIVISVKNALTDPDLSNPKTTSFPEYPKVILYTKFEHFGIICF